MSSNVAIPSNIISLRCLKNNTSLVSAQYVPGTTHIIIFKQLNKIVVCPVDRWGNRLWEIK